MSNYDLYIFILCMIVLIALTSFFIFLIVHIYKMYIKLIRGGQFDRDISIREEKKEKRKKRSPFLSFTVDKLIPGLILLSTISLFVISITNKVNEHKPVGNIPTLKVVTSESMATKNKKNTYLNEQNLNTQMQKFDLIQIHALPNINELKLYDVVVYEIDEIYVIHRIVKINDISETNKEKTFVLQGDANEYSDKNVVTYSQMRGIYKGNRIPYVGSFLLFLQSPAGYVCLLLILIITICYPIIDKKLNKQMNNRLIYINKGSSGNNNQLIPSFTTKTFSKSAIATYALEVFGNAIDIVPNGSEIEELNNADTYYSVNGDYKECIAYVNVTKDNSLEIIFRSNKAIENLASKRHLPVKRSDLPKQDNETWLIMKISSYSDKNMNRIVDTISIFDVKRQANI